MNSATKAKDTRQRVLDVAARQFRERGYAGVSLRDIADGAGMKAGSLYYHFRSKDEIVATVLDIGIELVQAAVGGAVAALPPDAPARILIATAVRQHLQTFLAYSDYTTANVRIFGQLPPEVRRANLPARRRYEALWDGIIERCRAQGGVRTSVDAATFRLFLLGAMNATLEWFDPAKGDIDRLADRYAGLALDGLLEPSES